MTEKHGIKEKQITMYNLCTISDNNFLLQGLSLYSSLKKYSDDFVLHYLYFGDIPLSDILKTVDIPNIKFYTLDDIDIPDQLNVYKDTNRSYFISTLKPHFMHHLHNTINDSITHIDSDIFFHAPIEELFKKFEGNDVGIFRHRQFSLEQNYVEGWFNAGLIYFGATKKAKLALDWWYDAVLYKKYPQLGTCADQKYFDAIYSDCDLDVYTDTDSDIGQGAPWHWQVLDLTRVKEGFISWNGREQKYIFTHFSSFKYNLQGGYFVPVTQHQCYTPIHAYSEENLKWVYDTYFSELKNNTIYFK